LKQKGKSIGFVPTMGALHEGHLKLVKTSIEQCDVTICSIFVNPTQFNNKSDLLKYPRELEKDSALLKKTGLQILFAPDDKEIYPNNLDTRVTLDLAGLDKVLEGFYRPRHFEGVVQVVKRLLDIVRPDVLFMGQKDFQQFTIIHHMIQKLELPVRLEVVSSERESHGLAMSSRNERLSLGLRQKAKVIFESLLEANRNLDKKPLAVIREKAIYNIRAAGLNPEYFEIVDGITLKTVEDPGQHKYIVGLVAAWAGDVRLIDNMIFKGDLSAISQ
jgi:pantoate--beta-alanine ligase